MTLATLKGMNFSMVDVANALKLKPADSMFGGVQQADDKPSEVSSTASDPAAGAADKRAAPRKSGKAASARAATGVVDPLQWWGALTQQFQQIAATAMKDAAAHTAVDTARNMAAGAGKGTMDTGAGMVKAATGAGRKTPARRRPAKKAIADR